MGLRRWKHWRSPGCVRTLKEQRGRVEAEVVEVRGGLAPCLRTWSVTDQKKYPVIRKSKEVTAMSGHGVRALCCCSAAVVEDKPHARVWLGPVSRIKTGQWGWEPVRFMVRDSLGVPETR